LLDGCDLGFGSWVDLEGELPSEPGDSVGVCLLQVFIIRNVDLVASIIVVSNGEWLEKAGDLLASSLQTLEVLGSYP
jgi:hypothetical protein